MCEELADAVPVCDPDELLDSLGVPELLPVDDDVIVWVRLGVMDVVTAPVPV